MIKKDFTGKAKYRGRVGTMVYGDRYPILKRSRRKLQLPDMECGLLSVPRIVCKRVSASRASAVQNRPLYV
jgi:hypothetical protein